MQGYLEPSLWIFVGFVVLIFGGEVLVRGASGMARAMRISPLIVGLTVVAFCTSCPELAVALKSSFEGKTEFAVGNIVGSCICNILFVLGLAAMAGALAVRARLIRLEIPLMILAAVLTLVFGFDGVVSRADGLILFAALIAYMIWTVIVSRRESNAVKEELAKRGDGHDEKSGAKVVLGHLALVCFGVALLVVSSGWLVDGAKAIAEQLGVSDLMIGLTILAIGTSLPEAATCVIASLRGERDIAVGNVIGSNIMNILAVLGLSSVIAPGGIPVSQTALHLDIPLMIIVSVACLPILFTGHRIERWEGALFFAYYIAYLVYLILAETNEGVARTFGSIMLYFALPLTAVTLLVLLMRSLKKPEPEGE